MIIENEECRTSGILFLFIFASQSIEAVYSGIGLFFMPFPLPVKPECPESSVIIDILPSLFGIKLFIPVNFIL